jgi:two-component system sensor histidine kinase KdpD
MADLSWPPEARARLEQLEAQLARFEELLRRKDEFISMVAHELRGPLTAVKGTACTLLRNQTRFDTASVTQLLRDIDAEADRLARLLDNLLELSRIEAGRARSPGVTRLAPLLRALVAETRPRTMDRPLRIRLERGLPSALADPFRVEQVVRNLLDNAIKYSPERARILLTAVRRARSIEIGVRNDGPPLDLSSLERIFDRFYRGPTADDHHSGTGLGLTICRRLVEAEGGRIWAEAVADGVAFKLTLPVASESAT